MREMLRQKERGWLLPGARKDEQSITADWELTNQPLIAGVSVKNVKHVPKENGFLVEFFRDEWKLDPGIVAQVFQVTLFGGKISAWHAHELTTDRLFVSDGLMKVVLFDAREGSPTRGAFNEFRVGRPRPVLIVVPPKVWHGVQNIGTADASIVNLTDRAYRYEDPDHWRLPPDAEEIPYSFARV